MAECSKEVRVECARELASLKQEIKDWRASENQRLDMEAKVVATERERLSRFLDKLEHRVSSVEKIVYLWSGGIAVVGGIVGGFVQPYIN
jgi:hypothetical protein